MFKKEIYFERYLEAMKVIKLTESCYVQPQAILILQAELALVGGAPSDVQAEWKAQTDQEAYRIDHMLLPGIKAVLVEQREIMLHFSSQETRDKRLAELVEEWKGE